MCAGDKDSVRAAAATALLERAWGRTVQDVEPRSPQRILVMAPGASVPPTLEAEIRGELGPRGRPALPGTPDDDEERPIRWPVETFRQTKKA